MFLSNAVASVGLPMLSNVRAEGDAAKYKRCLFINFLMTATPAMLIAIPVAIGSRFIVGLYGPAFRDGATALSLISIYAVLAAANIPVGHALWSLEATRAAVWLGLLNGVVLVSGAYAFAGRGAAGLAGAYLIMGLVQTAVNIPFLMWLLRRKFAVAVPPAEPVLV
jgi:O-antigen/teichoic acid export membrane protein